MNVNEYELTARPKLVRDARKVEVAESPRRGDGRETAAAGAATPESQPVGGTSDGTSRPPRDARVPPPRPSLPAVLKAAMLRAIVDLWAVGG